MSQLVRQYSSVNLMTLQTSTRTLAPPGWTAQSNSAQRLALGIYGRQGGHQRRASQAWWEIAILDRTHIAILFSVVISGSTYVHIRATAIHRMTLEGNSKDALTPLAVQLPFAFKLSSRFGTAWPGDLKYIRCLGIHAHGWLKGCLLNLVGEDGHERAIQGPKRFMKAHISIEASFERNHG
ncbi:hypothetical protein BC835DRAFT_1307520 [Cytidiella melzeri]|nr:hypothetical protein BC835DRAFT_1307520 [Cytidiella melzeri]